MAYVDPNQKQIDPNDPNAQSAEQGGGAPMGDPSAGSPFAGQAEGGVSRVGAGGQGGWTNIQDYLKANQGSSGTAQALNQNVGGLFDKEQQNLTGQAADVKGKAQAAADQTKIGQDQASQMVSQAAQYYQYPQTPGAAPAPQSNSSSGGLSTVTPHSYAERTASVQPAAQPQDPAAYQNAINPLKSALSAQYAGPTQFSYGVGGDASQAGADLGNDQGFQGLLSRLYNQASGGHMNSGAVALQNQLDTNNDAVTNARNALAAKYAGLQDTLGSTLTDTNAALQSAQDQFKQNQTDLRGYLQGEQTKDQGAIGQRVSDINSYLGTLNNDIINHAKATTPLANAEGTSTYQAPEVTQSNATGVDAERNAFNTIADILGLGGTIGKSDPYGLRNVNANVHLSGVTNDSQTVPIDQTTNFGDYFGSRETDRDFDPLYQQALSLGLAQPRIR